MRQLDVALPDEIRGVMDRLLASDEAIQAAHQASELQPLFDTAEEGGMSEAENVAYRESADRLRHHEQNLLDQKLLRVKKQEQTAEWKRNRERLRAEVEADVNARPVFQAKHWLQHGELLDRETPENWTHVKLDRKWLIRNYGEKILKLLPNRPTRVWQRGGVHPDTTADLFGFGSGDQLVRALVASGKREQVIDEETDARMRRLYGDLETSGQIEEAALDSIANEQRIDFMLTEERLLIRRSAGTLTPKQLAEDAAKRVILAKRIRGLRPHLYRQAAVRAGRQAVEAVKAEKFEEAAAHRRRQVFDSYREIEARKALEEVDKAGDYLRGFDQKRVRDRIKKAGANYMDRIDGLLERFDFRKGITLKDTVRRESLAEWIKEQEDNGEVVLISSKLRNEAFRKPYRELTVEEVYELRDAVKNIEHLAKTKNKLLADRQQREFEAGKALLITTIHEENEQLKRSKNESATKMEKVLDGFSLTHAFHLKPETLFRRLDGFKPLGPVWELLYKPINDSDRAELIKKRELADKWTEIFGKIDSSDRVGWLTNRVYVPEIGKNYTRANFIMAALNVGNDYSRSALMEGEGWTADQLDAVLDHLTEAEWQVVDEV
jgi:hypothetical protein